jgi:aspartate kinase
MKFGGTSVADLDKIANAADKVRQEVETGFEVVVIVSAMSGKTNELVRWVKDCTSKSGDFDKAEYDAVVSSGENVTSGLMALQLQAKGISTRSWQGWQSSHTLHRSTWSRKDRRNSNQKSGCILCQPGSKSLLLLVFKA